MFGFRRRASAGGRGVPLEAAGVFPGLAERESEQARTEQHKAGCGYREKSVGYEVVLKHVHLHIGCWSELIKIFGISAFAMVLRDAPDQALER